MAAGPASSRGRLPTTPSSLRHHPTRKPARHGQVSPWAGGCHVLDMTRGDGIASRSRNDWTNRLPPNMKSHVRGQPVNGWRGEGPHLLVSMSQTVRNCALWPMSTSAWRAYLMSTSPRSAALPSPPRCADHHDRRGRRNGHRTTPSSRATVAHRQHPQAYNHGNRCSRPPYSDGSIKKGPPHRAR